MVYNKSNADLFLLIVYNMQPRNLSHIIPKWTFKDSYLEFYNGIANWWAAVQNLKRVAGLQTLSAVMGF